jgi:hypothetical protein
VAGRSEGQAGLGGMKARGGGKGERDEGRDLREGGRVRRQGRRGRGMKEVRGRECGWIKGRENE